MGRYGPPRRFLGLVHDLTGGYTALWARAVEVLGIAFALTGVRHET
ncbi:MAG: hypothetical protein WA776_02090 [Xanthobacteraceae bacterium]